MERRDLRGAPSLPACSGVRSAERAGQKAPPGQLLRSPRACALHPPLSLGYQRVCPAPPHHRSNNLSRWGLRGDSREGAAAPGERGPGGWGGGVAAQRPGCCGESPWPRRTLRVPNESSILRSGWHVQTAEARGRRKHDPLPHFRRQVQGSPSRPVTDPVTTSLRASCWSTHMRGMHVSECAHPHSDSE